MAYALLKSVHLLAVVIWVGGMFFASFCLRPAALTLDPPNRVGLMRDALRRFLNLVIIAVVLILVSGTWMIATASKTSVNFGLGFNMPIDWHVMVTLGVLMMAVFGYIRFALLPLVDTCAAAKDWPAAGAALTRIRALVNLNLVLAAVIIVVTRIGAIA